MAELVTARQNAIYDCTHIYLDAFDKKRTDRRFVQQSGCGVS